MDLKRLGFIISGLNAFKLTQHEKRFLELVEVYFRERGMLTEEQETMLEGIYKEKLTWERLGLITRQTAAKGAISKNPVQFPNKVQLKSLGEHRHL